MAYVLDIVLDLLALHAQVGEWTHLALLHDWGSGGKNYASLYMPVNETIRGAYKKCRPHRPPSFVKLLNSASTS